MTGDEPEDVALLLAHVKGDPDAFAELVRRHRDRLWAVALRTTGDPEDAADALQDALVSAFRRAESFRGEAQVTTWLHRIVVNACLDRLRRQAAHPTQTLSDDTVPDELVGSPEPVSDASATRVDVWAALQALHPDQRAALVLVDIEGYSVAEAAEILNCAPGTVKSRCSRARVRLAGLLSGYRRNPGGGVDVKSSSPAPTGPPDTAPQGRARDEGPTP